MKTDKHGWRRREPTAKHATSTKMRPRGCRRRGFENNDVEGTVWLPCEDGESKSSSSTKEMDEQ